MSPAAQAQDKDLRLWCTLPAAGTVEVRERWSPMMLRSCPGLVVGTRSRSREVGTGCARTHRTRSAVTAGSVAVLVGLIGCATESTTTPASSAAAASAPVATVPAAVTLSSDALLTAAQMPAWNGAMGWAEQQLPPGVSALTVCVLPSAESLGSVQVLTRDFEAAGVEDPEITPDPEWPAAYAVNEVAQFPDETTAAAAVSAWQDAAQDCAPGPSSTNVQSFQLSDLPTGSTWTAASDQPSLCPECLRFEFFGFASKGAATTMVGFSLSGQDANYEGDPLAESMDAALARLP